MAEKLRLLLAEVLRLEPGEIRDKTAMRETPAWDSLRHMQLVAALEDAFGLELTVEEIVAMQDVGAIRRVLRARGVADGGADQPAE
jgi:acyl carrier protein